MEIIKKIIEDRKLLIISLLILIVITLFFIVAIFFMFSSKKEENIDNKEEPLAIEKIEKESKKEEVIKYTVDIKGAVNNPGVYSLTKGSTVLDVINMAGGLKDIADTSVINLSKKIIDEMVIIIYTKEEVSNFNKVKEKEILEEKKCKNNEVIVNDACKENNNSNNNSSDNNNKEENKIVNINTATLEELMSLTGIGEGKAKDIISYRESNGPFEKIEDLMNVSGIGESTFAKIKENITV